MTKKKSVLSGAGLGGRHCGCHPYTQKLRPNESLQLVRNLDRPQEKFGIKILPLGSWLEELPTENIGYF